MFVTKCYRFHLASFDNTFGVSIRLATQERRDLEDIVLFRPSRLVLDRGPSRARRGLGLRLRCRTQRCRRNRLGLPRTYRGCLGGRTWMRLVLAAASAPQVEDRGALRARR